MMLFDDLCSKTKKWRKCYHISHALSSERHSEERASMPFAPKWSDEPRTETPNLEPYAGAGVPAALPVSSLPVKALIRFFFFFLRTTTTGLAPYLPSASFIPQVKHSAPSGTSQNMLRQILQTKPLSMTFLWQKQAARKSTESCVGVTRWARASASGRNPNMR